MFSGFHEAVSDAIGLTIFTPQHFNQIGLYNNSLDDYESNINFLMLIALQKVAYLPFAYIVDQVGEFKKKSYYIFLNRTLKRNEFLVEMASIQ